MVERSLLDFSRHLSSVLVVHRIPCSIQSDRLIKILVKSHFFSLFPSVRMYSRAAIHLTRCGSSSLRRSQLILRSHPTRCLFELPRRGQIRPWYRRFWPLAIASVGLPTGYLVYRNVLYDQIWTSEKSSLEESFDDNSESVSQSELDSLLSQTQQLLDAELYSTRSSSFLVPLRLFFRTIKLILVFTPVITFYFIQDKFAPQWYERWCLTLKR